MREIRQSGSEGGATQTNASSLPLSGERPMRFSYAPSIHRPNRAIRYPASDNESSTLRIDKNSQTARLSFVKSFGLFDAKNRLSEICDQVARSGEPCTVTRRGKPLVRIVPVDESSGSVWDTVEEAQARYGPITEELELPARNPARNRPTPF